MTDLLLGDEAIGLAAVDAGIRGAFSYPGTPATEIFETIEQATAHDGRVAARWSANEKVAYEEALGMSFTGHRAIVSMKHVGLNVAADPFMSSALTGVVGGLVLAVADDPGMHSSQNEQDTRVLGGFAQIPIFEPSNQQEAYDLTREAFRYSERFGLPVLVRLTTRLAHSRAAVQRSSPDEVRSENNRHGDPKNWTLLPVNARRRYRALIELQKTLEEYAEKSPFNRLSLRGRKGIIAAGLANNYVREVIGDETEYSVLKLSVYPVPTELVRRLVDHCDEILVVEEGFPVIESALTGLLGVPGKIIRGRRTGAIPPDGELTVERIRAALNLPDPRRASAAMTNRNTPRAEAGDAGLNTLDALDDLPARPPVLCAGCPHCDTFRAIVDALGPEMNPLLFSDIGCYTLGAMPPYKAVHTCVDMGASISMALGAAKAGAHPILCSIGDSTFTHSGMTPLLGAAQENANMTVVILDNAIVAMTGGQEGFASGEKLIRLIQGLGVDERHIVHFEPLPKNHEENAERIRQEVDYRGLSVIVASRPCIHIKRREGAAPVTVRV